MKHNFGGNGGYLAGRPPDRTENLIKHIYREYETYLDLLRNNVPVLPLFISIGMGSLQVLK